MVKPTVIRSDLAAHEAAIRQPDDVVVKELRELISPRLIAVIAGVKETRAVHEWADGVRRVGSADRMRRLRTAYQAARLVSDAEGYPGIAQAWMQGMNPLLSDQSPARVLRDGDPDEDGPRVIEAARHFAANG